MGPHMSPKVTLLVKILLIKISSSTLSHFINLLNSHVFDSYDSHSSTELNIFSHKNEFVKILFLIQDSRLYVIKTFELMSILETRYQGRPRPQWPLITPSVHHLSLYHSPSPDFAFLISDMNVCSTKHIFPRSCSILLHLSAPECPGNIA